MKLRLLLAANAALLAACGQTGDLYLPESRQGTVITRPPPEPPAAPSPTAPPGNSAGTVDGPSKPTAPAPEVSPPPGAQAGDARDAAKKKAGAPPPD
jgi:predicted small lipoprotein YifL